LAENLGSEECHKGGDGSVACEEQQAIKHMLSALTG